MRLRARRFRFPIFIAAATVAYLWPAASAQAFVSCTYDATWKGVTVSLTSVGDAATVARDGSAISVNGGSCGGATVSNTDTIWVAGGFGSRSLTVDLSGGQFAPGASAESAGEAEIEIIADLGPDPSLASITVTGSGAADNILAGTDGVNLNGDDDADLLLSSPSLNFGLFRILGGAGDDVLSAAGDQGTGAAWPAAVTLDGGDGSDTVSGGAGPGTINGGAGDDLLSGGAGNDTIGGGDGNDTLSGGAGNDTLAGGDGNDVFAEGATANGADLLAGGAGIDTVTYAERTTSVTVKLDDAANDGEANEGDNVQTDVEGVAGGGGDDTIVGSAAANVLSGGGGDDSLDGDMGNDTLSGGPGADTFLEGSAANGADAFSGGEGEDLVSYSLRANPIVATIDGAANDGEASEGDNVQTDVEDITGGAAADTLTGSAAANVLSGGSADDSLSGGGGADSLRGGPGSDSEDGGSGDDLFLEDAAQSGGDRFVGGAGTDSVSYADRTNAIKVTIDGNADDGETGENDNVSTDVECVLGGAGDDVLSGSSAGNALRGNAGNDKLDGVDGNDTLVGGPGNDNESGGAGNDVFLEDTATNGADVFAGGAGVDTISYAERINPVTVTIGAKPDDGETSEGDNVRSDIENITGGLADDKLTGSKSDNILRGNSGKDVLKGLAGNDRLDGGAGDDTESGGAGDDIFVEGSASNGADTFNGGAGTDTVSYAGRKSSVRASIDGVANDGVADERDNLKTSVENLNGGSGADKLKGSSGSNVLSGGRGNDLLSGGAGKDILSGGPGKDKLLGGPGNDVFRAGDKYADILNGGAGVDRAGSYDRKLDTLISIP